MLDLKVITIFIFITTSFVWNVDAECIINVHGDAPIFSKTLGSKTLVIRNGQSNMVLKRGETIRADCPRQISVRNIDHYRNSNEVIGENEAATYVNLKCVWSSNYGSDRFSCKIVEDLGYSALSTSTISIKCIQGKRQLYESNMTLPNCQSYTSYVIGTQSTLRDPIISASICFNINNLAVKYVKYLPNRLDYEFYELKESAPPKNLGLSTPIEGFDILFKSSSTFDASIALFKKSNPLLELHNFSYSSLIQDSTISAELFNFNFMFNTIWWDNLRLGSWKFFLEALKSRTENGKYELYTGTSGVMTVPSSSECKQLEEFTVKHDSREVQAPGIIWAYLRSIQGNETEEFVVVGHNTPFNLVANSTQLCKDMCQELDWLKGSLFSKVHLMPTFGVVECCRAREVQYKLQGFPIDLLAEETTATESRIGSE